MPVLKVKPGTAEVLEGAACQLAKMAQDDLTREVAGELIGYLEGLARAPLGSWDADPTVVLLRRFARAQRQLLARPCLPALDVARVVEYVAALGDPATALLTSCQTGIDDAP